MKLAHILNFQRFVFYNLQAQLISLILYFTPDTDGSSVYDEDPRFKSLAEFNQRIQREGNEVKRLLDLALAEKKETEKVGCFKFYSIIFRSQVVISFLIIL